MFSVLSESISKLLVKPCLEVLQLASRDNVIVLEYLTSTFKLLPYHVTG